MNNKDAYLKDFSELFKKDKVYLDDLVLELTEMKNYYDKHKCKLYIEWKYNSIMCEEIE